ncbi:hypothetical protein CVT24_010699 [Panaeolus cyanescens]|uniref:Enhancer of polycomb-like protein n=1 Tax=Panaeolus cyanescens TaxID=181874 RepID=A0A409YVV8_9AGAR|nr:hypothetical protein CVT24_010699 [Panaeolus cyanescens]
MPRNHLPATSTLRNRNRITNKTRLKIVRGSVDAEIAFIPDEDDEKLRLTNLVAGVDAEDANEHHLQEVLSAHRTAQNSSKPTKGAEKVVEAPAAYIPIPENNGVVDNYDELYQANRWTDPVSYVCSSTTADEYITNGINNGFTYYMDERDQAWLEKNNEEARGEGTSAQGAVSGTPTRLARSSKSKGKEPDHSPSVIISEDEFELVMGIFEYVTHEKTEYLHHSLETGMEFPPFTNYQSVFASPLPASMFSNFVVPSWIPLSTTLVKIAKAVYPYWRERRIERKGHRIIPALNGDESDTLNESYVCFRRRESKVVRKTRASQASSSDKLARLQLELAVPLDIAKAVLERERLKKDAFKLSQEVWEKRRAFADLKRKFPALGDRMDDELLVDRERPLKKPEIQRPLPLKIKPNEVVIPPRVEIGIRPKDRLAKINEIVEARLARQKDLDQGWEDGIDNSFQSPPTSYASRLFKYIPPSGSPAWPSSPTSSTSGSERSDDDCDELPSVRRAPRRAIRLRYGRGGRLHVDRRETRLSTLKKKYGSSLFGVDSIPEDMDTEMSQDPDSWEQLEQRWHFDNDDAPAKGPLGSEEDDRVLVDDYTPSILATSMSLLNDRDVQHLTTDATLLFDTPNGRTQSLPYVLGHVPFRRDIRDSQGRLLPPLVVPPQPPLLGSSTFHSVPVSVPQHKKMSSLSSAPPMRISSGGGMRIPSGPPLQTNGLAPHASPPNPVAIPQVSPTTSVNGISRAAISMPHVEIAKPEPPSTPSISSPKIPLPLDAAEIVARGIPARPPSQNLNQPQPIPISTQPNGFHANPVPNISSAYLNQQHQGGLTYAQMQNLKSALSGVPNLNDITALSNMNRHAGNFMHPGTMVNGNGVPMQLNANAVKMQNARMMQWAMSNGMNVNGGMGIQRPPSIVNGHDGQLNVNGQMNGVNGMGSPNHMHAVPIRSPSANGVNSMRNGIHINGQHSMSPPHQLSMSPHLSPPPLSNISQSQSPRLSMTPTLGMPSPSLQHQQAINGSQNGF